MPIICSGPATAACVPTFVADSAAPLTTMTVSTTLGATRTVSMMSVVELGDWSPIVHVRTEPFSVAAGTDETKASPAPSVSTTTTDRAETLGAAFV